MLDRPAAGQGSVSRATNADDAVSLPHHPDHDLVLVVRDLYRHPRARAVVAAVIATRPDAVAVELGLPVLDPGGRAWVTTRGASRAAADAVTRRLLGATP